MPTVDVAFHHHDKTPPPKKYSPVSQTDSGLVLLAKTDSTASMLADDDEQREAGKKRGSASAFWTTPTTNGGKDKMKYLTAAKKRGVAGRGLHRRRSSTRCCSAGAWMRRRENLLVVATVAAVFIGAAIGIGVRWAADGRLSPWTVSVISFPGEILMHMLKMIVIPLIVSSLIAGLARLDARQSGRIGSLTVAYYLSTTVIAVATGVVLVMLIRPGQMQQIRGTEVVIVAPRARDGADQPPAARPTTVDTMLDLVRNMFPENVLQSALQHQQTQYVEHVKHADGRVEYRPKVVYKDGMNIIGLIVFAMGFGIVLGQMGAAGRTLVDFFSAFEQVIMRLVQTIMWFSPIGIASLIAGKILELEDVAATVQSLALFTATVVGGQSFHLFVSLPLLYFMLTRENPFHLMRGLIQAWTTALGTASSAATLPVTYACMEQNLGIDRRVTRFVLPVGATINMDGTALYEAVAAIFIAEMNGMQLGFGQIITVSLTATLASIGAASIPHGGFVMLVLVLAAIGLPAQDVSLVVAVDWFIDRFRTAVNVLGDAFGAGIVHHFTKDHLDELDDEGLNGDGASSSFAPSDEQRRPSLLLTADRRKTSATPTAKSSNVALTIEVGEDGKVRSQNQQFNGFNPYTGGGGSYQQQQRRLAA